MDLTDPSVQAFPKTLRLLSRWQFTRVGRKGRRFYTGDLVILAEGNSLGLTRLGITAGRHAGNSVKRNRSKRLIREYFRLHRPRFAAGYDLVVIVKNAAALAQLRDVERNFEHFFRKAAFMDGSRTGGPNHAGSNRPL